MKLDLKRKEYHSRILKDVKGDDTAFTKVKDHIHSVRALYTQAMIKLDAVSQHSILWSAKRDSFQDIRFCFMKLTMSYCFIIKPIFRL